MKKSFIAVAVAGALAAGSAEASQVSASLSQPASISLKETVSGCSNNPGPFITLTGEINLGGFAARIILTNNARWTHQTSADIAVDVNLLDAGESIQIAKQPSRGGVGGNPHIYLQFNDCKGNPANEYTYLGRCVQGLHDSTLDFQLPTDVTVDVSAASCSNNPGPFITLGGELKLGGFCAQIVFTNNAKFTHVAQTDTVVDVVLIPEGESLTFAKQPSQGGAGGNPHIWVQFLDGSGGAVGAPLYVGRCNQLGR